MIFQNIEEFANFFLQSHLFQGKGVVCFALKDDTDLIDTPFELVFGDPRALGLKAKIWNFAFFLSKTSNFLNSSFFVSNNQLLKGLASLKSGKKALLTFEVPLASGKKHVLLRFAVFYSAPKKAYGFLVQRLLGLEEQINVFCQKAQLDFTTGLLGKERCLNDINSLKLDGKSYVVFMDMNNFKMVNDVYGHEIGDGILKSFASALLEQASSRYNCYRFGGDEFVVIGKDTTESEMSAFLDRSFALFKANEPYKVSATFSAGVVRAYSFLRNHLLLIRCSDQAMYLAKKNKLLYYVLSEKEARGLVEEKTAVRN